MAGTSCRGQSRLPDCWQSSVKSAVLTIMSLAHYAVVQASGKASEYPDERLRRRVEDQRLDQEIRLRREEIRLKDARMNQVAALRRPRYQPADRLAILELKAVRGWSLSQAAQQFLVTPATISSWQRRVDEDGPQALVAIPQSVNKFPQFVGYIARRLKTLCSPLGKRKIAAILARAGLHLSATTVARILREPSPPVPAAPAPKLRSRLVVTAKRPNHVWHVDLTCVLIGGGFWCAWLPWALPQCWPFCWWLAVVVDHRSRRAMGAAAFAKQPSSNSVRAFLARTISKAKSAPQHLVCDRGGQFDCDGFRRWCRRRGIRPRYGAIGQHGSIAVVERFIRTLKEGLGMLALMPLRPRKLQQELSLFNAWYNEHRPHEALGGRTPDEVYQHRFPAHRRPRHEPRERWPRGSPCSLPWALVAGKPVARLELQVTFHAGRKHLPVVTLKRVA